MRRELVYTSRFVRAARRLTKKQAGLATVINAALTLLADDALHPALKTHKLKGNHSGLWACSAGYDLRIIFEFVLREGSEAILLLSIGSHDAVY